MKDRMSCRAGRRWAPTYVVACLFLTIFLAGCQGSSPPPEPVTIRFAYLEDLIDKDYYEPLVEAFNERYPHITVELTARTWERYYESPAAAADADVFIAADWTMHMLRSHGYIVNLSPSIQQDESFDLSDFYPGVVDRFTIDDELWAVPAGVDMDVMYYNRDLFDEYGVPYPEAGWTWDDFLDKALALRDPRNNVFGYGPWEDHFDSVNFMYQHGGQIFDDLQNPTRPTFDDPLNVEALEWYADLIYEQNVAPTPDQARRLNRMGSEDPYVGVVEGRVGMWMGSVSGQAGGMYGGWKFRWGIVSLPRDARSATQAWPYGYVISSQASSYDACWRWAVFLSEQMSGRLAPARKSLVESSRYEQLAGEDVVAAGRESLESAMLVSYGVLFSDYIGEMTRLFTALDRAVEGDATPQEALDWAQAEAEKLGP